MKKDLGGDTSFDTAGRNISALPSDVQNKVQKAFDAVNAECVAKGETLKVLSNFKYYTTDELIAIGVEDATMDMIIDFNKRDVISIVGVKYDGKMYYRHFDLGEGENVEYTPVTDAPTFSLEKRIYGLNGKIILKDISYAINVANGRIYYAKENTENWIQAQSNEISINETGNYKVKIVDSMGNTSDIQTMNITLVNSPKLATRNGASCMGL